MADKDFDAAPAAEATPAPTVGTETGEQVTIRAYAEAAKLKKWQVILLRDRLGLDTVMTSSAIAEALDKFSKERI